MPTNPLFRFVAVRSPQLADEERVGWRFVRLPGNGRPRTDFQEAIERVDSLADAVGLAAAYIGTDRYGQAFDASDRRLRLLHRVYAVLVAFVRGAGDGDAGDVARDVDVLWAPDELPLEQFRPLQLVLWDALVAAYLAPRRDPRDRAALIDPLRALQFLETHPTTASADDLRDLVGATPLIPLWVRQAGRQAPDPDPVDVPPPGLADNGAALRVEFAALERADADLRDTATLLRTAGKRRARIETHPMDREDGDGRQLFTATISGQHDDEDKPDALSRSVNAQTAAVLASLDDDWRQRSVRQLRAMVQLRQSRVHRELIDVEARQHLAAAAPAGARAVTGEATTQPGAGDFSNTIEGSVRRIRPAGVGDLLLVEERLLGYEHGEIAHIENVLLSESKERMHRRLDREVETTFASTEEASETERDLQSTTRLEVASEAERTQAQQTSLALGLTVSGGFGPVVEAEASSEFAISSSVEESVSTSTEYAQEIVDRTVTRVAQSIREEITHKTLAEVEEVNTHGFDNTNGSGHVIGIYRWLEKVYGSRILNYGRRLMYDFVVPEPAAFFRYAANAEVDRSAGATPPLPLTADFGFLDVTPTTYHTWVDLYRVGDVSPPPPEEVFVTKVFDQPVLAPTAPEGVIAATRTDSITVPAGYVAVEASATSALIVYYADYYLGVAIGDQMLSMSAGDVVDQLGGYQDPVAVALYARDVAAHVVTIEVRCERTEETLREWQLDTYGRIVAAYQTQVDDYDAKLAAQRASSEAVVFGLSSDAKRALEQRELKRGCLQLLTDQHFIDFDATADAAPPFGYPEFTIDEAAEEAPYVRFLEQLFEFEHMLYVFYPYFWGRKCHWVENSSIADPDPVFEGFLRAGAARVVVPVRRGYEKALFYYMTTGEIWNGGQVPVLDDELYVSIIDELVAAEGLSLTDARPYGRPWTYRLPTALVKLQEDAELPTWPPFPGSAGGDEPTEPEETTDPEVPTESARR